MERSKGDFMTNRLNVEQKRLVEDFRKTHVESANLSDAEILTIMNEQYNNTKLSEDEKISTFWNENNDNFNPTLIKQTKNKSIILKSGRKIVVENGITKYFAANGTELNQKYFEQQEGNIDIKPSGRYSITKAGKTKYYAANGTEIKESYFKQVENSDVMIQLQDGKTYNLNKTFEKRINSVAQSLQKAEKDNGFIGKAWSGFKNLTGIGDSSDKVREEQKKEQELLNQFNSNSNRRAEIFKELTGQDYNEENLVKFIQGEIKLKSELALKGYTEGQDMACDITGDIVSGIAAVGIYTAAVAAAPFTGGASIALGVAAAGASGALIKTGLKFADAKSGGREYNSIARDLATGAFSGVLAPVTGGMGGAVGKTVATKCGIEVLKQGTKEVVTTTAEQGIKQGIKTAFVNATGYSYGGAIAKRALAYGAEMATDGALGGAIDTAFRTAYDGGDASDVLMAGVEGGIGGLFLAPVIGGGIKLSGKAGHALAKANTDLEDALANVVKELKLKPNQPSKQGSSLYKNVKMLFGTGKSAKLLKSTQYSKKPFVKKGEPRFTSNQVNKFLNNIENPFLKRNREYATDLFNRIANLSDESEIASFYHFKEENITDILSLVDKNNKDVLELMLTVKDNGNSVFDENSFVEIFKIFSDCDYELSKKVMKMFENNLYLANETKELKQFMSLAKEYPDEVAIVSSNFHPDNLGKFYYDNGKTVEDLLKRIKQCTLEEKELVSILCSHKKAVRYIDNEEIIKLLDADLGLNNKQIITYLKNHQMYVGGPLDKIIAKFKEIKGKEFSVSTENKYIKNTPMTKNDMINYLKNIGVPEDESNIFINFEGAEVLIQLIELDTSSGGKMFSGMSKRNIIKSYVEVITSGQEEAVNFLKIFNPVSQYMNVENYKLYKLNGGKDGVNFFLDDLGENVINIECQTTVQTVKKLTGKTVYQQDTAALGADVLKLVELSEQDITLGINKLRELNLIKDDANILTLLTRTKDLIELDITPELKSFSAYLSSNKYMEEGSIIDILKAVQAGTKDITDMKINFAKELLEKTSVDYNAVVPILNNLSSKNVEVINKQISILQKISKEDYRFVEDYAKFFKTDDLSEFNHFCDFINALNKHNIKDYNKMQLIDMAMQGKNNNAWKMEITDFMMQLLNKNVECSEIVSAASNVYTYGKNNPKEFMSLYLKGLNTDLGSLKDCYGDIIVLQMSDINTLNIRERLSLYDKLSVIDDNGKAILKQLGFNYDNLLDKVINSLGAKRPLTSVAPAKGQLFLKQIIANNNPKAEKILQEFDFAQFGKEGLPLKYPRDKFNTNVETLLKDLSEDEVEIILKHFGLEKGAAGFDGLPNNRIFNNNQVSKKAQQVAQKIQQEIENFVSNNEVMLSDIEAKEVLDGLIKGLPEFTSIVGKQQHGTHAYSVDIHTLKVLQSAMNDPLYKTLSDRNKTILKYSILLHDLGKKGGVVDTGHAGLSADYTWSILDRYQFQAAIKDRIIDIVDNHHWFEAYNKGVANAENVAVRCRRPEDLKIYEIFSKADFENVNPTFHLGDKSGGATTKAEFDEFMKSKFKNVEEALNKIYQKANYVFDTQFMHGGKQFPTKQVTINGKVEELKVLNFSELKEGANLAQYGFAPNVTRDNARFVVHMTNPKHSNMETVFRLTETPVFQSTWSSSMIQFSNNRTYGYKQFGLIFDVPQANISEAFFKNSGSGCEKGIDAFEHFLFGSRTMTIDGTTYDIRHFVKNNFMKEMAQKGYDLNETEYAALSQYLFNKKYTSQIRTDVQVGDKVIKSEDLVEALEKSRDTLFEGGDAHSEIIPINPKVKGLIAKVEKIEDCPQEFLNFAKEHDLPIILMKPTDKDITSKKLSFKK